MDLGSTISVSNTTSSMSTQTSEVKSKTSDSSFDKEMKSQESKETAKSTQESENTKDSKDVKETDVKDTKEDKSEKVSDNKSQNNQTIDKESEKIISADMLEGAVNFTDFKYHNESMDILSQNIQSLLDTKDLMNTVSSAEIFDYDVVNMSDSDANFFLNLTTGVSMKDIAAQLTSENTGNIGKNVQVSSVLMEKLAESLKTNQPFRIDFDKDVSVIIKVNKDGSLSANFIPGDKAVEQYLRNNISTLRQRFDEENLPYSELSYGRHNGRERQNRNKKENDNE